MLLFELLFTVVMTVIHARTQTDEGHLASESTMKTWEKNDSETVNVSDYSKQSERWRIRFKHFLFHVNTKDIYNIYS